AGCHKDDRYSRGRGLRSKCRGSARDCVNHGHLAANEIRQQHWKSIVLILRPAVFDSHVLALDIAGFAQAPTERAQTAREHVRRFTAEVSDHGHRWLLRTRRERPRSRRAAECSQQFPPSDRDCHTPLPCEVRKGNGTTPQVSRSRRAGWLALFASTLRRDFFGSIASPARLSTGNGHESRFQVAGGHFSHIASAAVLFAVRGSRDKIPEGRFGVCPQAEAGWSYTAHCGFC